MVWPDKRHPPTKAGLTLDSLPVFAGYYCLFSTMWGIYMYINIYIYTYNYTYIYIYIYLFIFKCDMVGPSEANPSFVREKHPAVPAVDIRVAVGWTWHRAWDSLTFSNQKASGYVGTKKVYV
jgi:hypothetical protein